MIELASDGDVLVFQKRSNFDQVWIGAPWTGRVVLIPDVNSRNLENGSMRLSKIHFVNEMDTERPEGMVTADALKYIDAKWMRKQTS